MKKLVNVLLIFITILLTGNTVNAAESTTTHLRMTPGKVVIKEAVKPGNKIYLYRYYVKNASTETKVVNLSATGNLIVEKESVTLKPQEKHYFDVYLEVPYSEKKKERSDYVVAQTQHTDTNSIKLEAKVEYKVADLKTTILTDNIWFFVGLFIVFVLIIILIIKIRKRKKKIVENNVSQEVEDGELLKENNDENIESDDAKEEVEKKEEK